MIKHIVAGGCSFTANGIGGVPPSESNPDGGCSFIDDQVFPAPIPGSWVGFVAKKLQVKSLVNVAANSHGNIATANNLMQVLTRFNYDPDQTLVLFNISDPSRLDLPCSWDHPEKSLFCAWPDSVIDFSYLSCSCQLVESAQKNIGIEQVNVLSTNALLGLLSFLTLNGFNFKFLTMRNYTQIEPLNKVIDNNKSSWISLGSGLGMIEYVMDLGLTVSDIDTHPNLQGHVMIADRVLEAL